MLSIRCWNERIFLNVLPDMDTRHIDLWTSSHRTVHTIDHLCNQWYTDLDWYSFRSCIVPNYLRSEATDYHHRHISDWGNHCNHLDSSYYMDNLEKWYIMKVLVDVQTIDAIIKSPSTFNKTVCIGAWLGTINVLKFALAFTFCCDIFISKSPFYKTR